MFFSQVHEDYYVKPLHTRLNQGTSFAKARADLRDDYYQSFFAEIAPYVAALKRDNPHVVNVRRKTALRLWELNGGDMQDGYYLQSAADQLRAQSNDSTPGNSATTATPESTITMSKATQTINYIFGRDVTTLKTDDLINAATTVKASIKTLQDTGLESTKVEALIAEHQASLAIVIAALDAS